ncbi:MAG TPA: hypothetical protein VE990_00150 [Acidimicrobiales bacterium]|nr:hypothetical protein [Acidimicrobiales bacterium]
MPDRTDSFASLRRPAPPLGPDPTFAASLRRRLERELGMTTADLNRSDSTAGRGGTDLDGTLAMVHLRVADADRAMAFLAALAGWEAERVPFDDHISHYTINTAVTVRILDDPGSAPVVPFYRMTMVSEAAAAVPAAGGRVVESGAEPDGGGWARAVDDQGLPFGMYRPRGYQGSAAPGRPATGEVGLVFMTADATRADRFYGPVLGWHLQRVHPDSNYFEAVPAVGVFDEAAAFGRPVAPSLRLYLSVPALSPALARVSELGGRAGEVAQDMGPYYTAWCSDDQGTGFGLMAEALQ